MIGQVVAGTGVTVRTSNGEEMEFEPFEIENLELPVKKGLITGLEEGKKIIAWQAQERDFKTKTGWFTSFGLGEDRDNYMFRSEWAVQGLVCGSAEEALFFNVYVDFDGNKLDTS